MINHISFYLCQGPTENTEEDFWRMILEGHIPTVIMLTRVFEGKVHDKDHSIM